MTGLLKVTGAGAGAGAEEKVGAGRDGWDEKVGAGAAGAGREEGKRKLRKGLNLPAIDTKLLKPR